jgi:uncharacterized protein YcfJ
MFYEVLMSKYAARGGNYHSRYLSEDERLRSFEDANEHRAERRLGGTSGRTIGAFAGGLGGALLGSGSGVGRAAIGGLAGAGLGYGLGYLGDKARDTRTIEARGIRGLTSEDRRSLLDRKRARKLDMEDEEQRRQISSTYYGYNPGSWNRDRTVVINRQPRHTIIRRR